MNRALVFGGGALVLGIAVAYAAATPGRALETERKAAKREGLFTHLSEVEPADIPGERAMPAIREALSQDKKGQKHRWDVEKAARKTVGGVASPKETALLRATLAADPDFGPRWQRAASLPRLGYDDGFSEKNSLYREESFDIERAGSTLAAAAKLGIQPRENIVAAAHLSALLSQDPVVYTQQTAARIGLRTLEVAKRIGLGQEAEAALGPPPKVRFVLSAELPMKLTWMAMLRSEEGRARFGGRDFDAKDRFGHFGPLGAQAEIGLIRLWRQAWRDLPGDPEDYDGAAKTLARDVPAIQSALLDYSPQFANTWGASLLSEYTETFSELARLQAARRAAKVLGPRNTAVAPSSRKG